MRCVPQTLFQMRTMSPSHLLMYLKILYYVDEEIVQGDVQD